jgi:beta-glucosidase
VLFGDVNPSGRLPVTFPRVLGQIPLYYNHRNTGRPPDPNNKFTSKYIDVPVTPRYPFGYGLSYTTSAYSSLKLSAARARVSDTITATVTVTNSGSREGTEVVQLYVRDDVASVSRPVRELKAFRRVTLKPGESRAVDLHIALRDLWFIGLDMKPVVEPGTFRVYVGPNSAEGLEASFECIR